MSLGEFERMADLARLRKKSSPSKPGIAPGAPATMLLMEGDYIEAKASDAGVGTVEVRNSAGVLIKTISFAPKAAFNVGPFRGTNSASFTCTAGSIDAVVGDAVLGAATVSDTGTGPDLLNDGITIIKAARLPDGDGVALYDGVINPLSGGLYPFSSASGAFTSADIGKVCAGWQGTRGQYKWFGTIVSVTSPTLVQLSLTIGGTAGSSIPSQLTACCLVYATDKTAEINARLAALQLYGGCNHIKGILGITGAITVPDGLTLEGPGRIGGADLPQNLIIGKKPSIVLLAPFNGSYGALTLGDGSGLGKPKLSGINMDGMMQCDYPVYMRTGSPMMEDSLGIRNRVNGAAVRLGTGSSFRDSVAIAHNLGHALVADGVADVHIIGGAAFGAGANCHGLKIANCVDVGVAGDFHAWKSSSEALAGSAIHIEAYGASGRTKDIGISGCIFDTSNGPHVDILTYDTCVIQGLTITGNRAFQNNSVPANTYPYMKFTAVGTGFVRGATIAGNTGDSSFANESLGTYTAFIEGAPVQPSLRAVSVLGNAINNCADGYLNFTPNASAANTCVPYNSGVTKTF